MARQQMDLLHGPLAGKIVRFALPIAAASMLQQLFSSADLAVLGRFDSSEAMAAVGSNTALVNLLVSLFMGLSIGGNVTVAARIGRGEKEKIHEAVQTIVTLALVSGVIVLAVGELAAPALLRLMNTPEKVYVLAALYLRIYFVALPFMLLYDFGSQILRAKGDSTRPLLALTLAGITNVVLNLFFVLALHMGVAGVGIATVISNALSAGMVLRFLVKDRGNIRLSFRELGIRREHLVSVIRIGAPAGLQGMVFALSNVVIQTAVNHFGAAGIAGTTAGQNFEFMAYFVVNGFAQAATTFTSQNFAAGKTDRCRRIYVDCMAIGMGAALAVAVIFYAFRSILLQIFTQDPEVLRYAVLRMRFVCLPELLTGTYEISGGCLRGMGHSLLPAVFTVVGSCLFRLVWIATVFARWKSYVMLVVVYPVSWILTGTAVITAYLIIRRREFAKFGGNSNKADKAERENT